MNLVMNKKLMNYKKQQLKNKQRLLHATIILFIIEEVE